MTNKQIRVCKIIAKYKNLPIILEKSDVGDYMDLQDFIGVQKLDFSDNNMDDNTIISLTNELIEIVEDRRRQNIDLWFTRTLAISAFIISVIALLAQLGILGLPRY